MRWWWWWRRRFFWGYRDDLGQFYLQHPPIGVLGPSPPVKNRSAGSEAEGTWAAWINPTRGDQDCATWTNPDMFVPSSQSVQHGSRTCSYIVVVTRVQCKTVQVFFSSKSPDCTREPSQSSPFPRMDPSRPGPATPLDWVCACRKCRTKGRVVPRMT